MAGSKAPRTRLPAYNGKLTVRVDAADDARYAWLDAPAAPRSAPASAPDDFDAYVAAVRRVFAPRPRGLVRLTAEATRLARETIARACANGCGRRGTHRAQGGDDDAYYCHNCMIVLGLPWRKVAQPEPMPEEEIARRRAARLAEEAIRRWRGDDVAWDRARPAFLTVPHRQGDGLVVAKMVGKLDLVNVAMIQALARDRDRLARKEDETGEWRDLAGGAVEPCLFHAHTPSQYHRKLDCPAPLDSVVVDFCYRNQIHWVFCYERRADEAGRREPGVLRFAPTHRFHRSPLAPEAEYDERWRVYLPDDQWERVLGVNEHRRRDGGVLLHVGKGRELILESPYIPQDQMIVLRRGRKQA